LATFTDFVVKHGLIVTEDATINQTLTVGQDAAINGVNVGSGGVATNTLLGSNALQNNISGTNNVAIGNNAGQDITGSNNVIIGSFSGNSNGLDISSSSGHVVLSDGSGVPRVVVNELGYVGVNNVSPTVELDIAGDILAQELTLTGSLSIGGSLLIEGGISAESIDIDSTFITLNNDMLEVPATENAGIVVNRGIDPDVSFYWNEVGNFWTTGEHPDQAGYAKLEAYIDGGTY